MPPRKKTEPEQAPEQTPESAPETVAAPEAEAAAPAVDIPETVTPLAPAEPVPAPRVYGATFAERRAAREEAEGKRVSANKAENKAVQ